LCGPACTQSKRRCGPAGTPHLKLDHAALDQAMTRQHLVERWNAQRENTLGALKIERRL
jgi:hypothetical protein